MICFTVKKPRWPPKIFANATHKTVHHCMSTRITENTGAHICTVDAPGQWTHIRNQTWWWVDVQVIYTQRQEPQWTMRKDMYRLFTCATTDISHKPCRKQTAANHVLKVTQTTGSAHQLLHYLCRIDRYNAANSSANGINVYSQAQRKPISSVWHSRKIGVLDTIQHTFLFCIVCISVTTTQAL